MFVTRNFVRKSVLAMVDSLEEGLDQRFGRLEANLQALHQSLAKLWMEFEKSQKSDKISAEGPSIIPKTTSKSSSDTSKSVDANPSMTQFKPKRKKS